MESHMKSVTYQLQYLKEITFKSGAKMTTVSQIDQVLNEIKRRILLQNAEVNIFVLKFDQFKRIMIYHRCNSCSKKISIYE